MSTQAHYWKMEDKAAAIQSPQQPDAGGYKRHRDDDHPDRRSRKAPNNNKGGKDGKGKNPLEGIRVVNVDANQVRYCGKWNGNGCTRQEKDCPSKARHACSFRMPNGRACGRTDHTAAQHR